MSSCAAPSAGAPDGVRRGPARVNPLEARAVQKVLTEIEGWACPVEYTLDTNGRTR
jgi:hypothetical protein